ncbi:MAG: ABC transporter ATP-binding protein, partial [Trueperaceae bacterium]
RGGQGIMQITLEGISKSFGNVEVLDELSLTIEEGELIALLGPSGCGKTTILFSICGIYRVDGGRILFGERDVSREPAQRRNTGVVFQAYALYPHMTVFDNIGFPLRVRGAPRSEIEAKVNEIAELVEIGELLKLRPAQLSGGQQQRVAVARALIRNPDVLLLDEPLSNLDARLRTTMRSEIKRIQRKTGITTILVTHDQVEATAMADRIVCMNQGRIEQVAEPHHIYENPENLFVAGFIGSPPINFIAGNVSGGGFSVNGTTVPVDVRASGPTTLGLRPEFVRLGEGQVAAEVVDAEPMGREILYVVETPLGTLSALRTEVKASFRVGDKSTIGWRSEEALFFDRDGQRIDG